jgi:molybdenum cofactor cytidylyltransferase
MTDIVHSLAIVPAAGQSERFGGMKLVADVDGEPLLDRTLRSLLDGGIDRVVVVLAPGASFPTVSRLCDHRVTIAVNPDPSRGMFSSIHVGLAAAAGDPIAVLPADMPFVRPDTIRALVEQCVRTGAAFVPAHAGRRGHPLVLPGALRYALLGADATTSLKEALLSLGSSPLEFPVRDDGVMRDVDTRDDLDTGRF